MENQTHNEEEDLAVNIVQNGELNEIILNGGNLENKEDDVEDLTVHCEPTLVEEEESLDEDNNDSVDLEEECVDPLEFLEVDQISNIESSDNEDYNQSESGNNEETVCGDTELVTTFNDNIYGPRAAAETVDVSEDSEDSQVSEYRANLTENTVQEDSGQALEIRQRRPRLELPVCEACGYLKKELSISLDSYRAIEEETLVYCDCASDKVECRVCNKTVKYSCYTTHLRRHKSVHHHVTPQGFFCNLCDGPFKSLKSLKHHQLSCKTKKYYKCVHCLETFRLKRLLVEHLKIHQKKEEEETYNCEICCIMFDNSSSKKEHIMEVHVAAQRFVCDTCGEAFVTECAMRRHVKTHNRNYSCKDCGQEFGARKDLLFHRYQHRSLKDLRCKICGSKFEHLSAYSEHKQIPCVIPESSVCDLCNKSFRDKNSLRKHLLTHTPISERAVLCDICNRNFSSPGALKKHVRLIHTDLRPYTCEFCSKSFNQLCKLKYHIVIHSSDKPVSCEICNKAFSNDKDIKIHMRTHTGEKPFQCNLCGKTFRQRGHVKTHQIVHTKERPFNCQLCDKRFGLPSSLKKHMKLHASRIVIPVR